MCVILHRVPGNEVSARDLRAAYCHNSDGCGLMYIDERGKLVIQKGLWAVEEMLDRVAAVGDAEYCLHLRIRTHGNVDENNCHPFPIWSNVALMHNGILSIKTPKEDYSDTWHFAKCLRKFKVGPWIHDTENLKAIEDFHGRWNRMCFMSPAGVARTGDWDEYGGNYWSNLLWRPMQVRSYYYNDQNYNWGNQEVDAEDATVAVDEDEIEAYIECPHCGEETLYFVGDRETVCECCTMEFTINYDNEDDGSNELICMPPRKEDMDDDDSWAYSRGIN